MEDNVIKVSVRPNKQNSVKVSSNVVSTPITANSDTSQLWSQVSKNWAISESIVDNTDYSSKYYANKAKESASNAQESESSVRDIYNGFLGETTEAIENVQGARDEAIANIETSRVEAIDNITTVKSESIASVEAKSDEILSAANQGIAEINNTKTTILNDIEFVADREKQEINDLADIIKDNADTVNTAIEAGVERLNSIDSLKNNQITNCLLEVPQNIKLELNNGTLTLKKGSKVIVPNGAGIFKEVVTTQDQSITYTWNPVNGRQCMVFTNEIGDISNSYMRDISTCLSGPTTPTITNYTWYDTGNNIVRTHLGTQQSFPIAIITQGSDGVTKSIDQVFNGFGYIGSTVWVDKGVKALAPNGRNTDGTLKNVEITTTKVSTYTRSLNGDIPLWLDSNGLSLTAGNAYDEVRNVVYVVGAEQTTLVRCQVAMTNLTGGKINSFQPKLPVHLLTYDDIKINNPFFFGQYIWSEFAPDNLSWLKSGGQWNSGSGYQSFYDWALANANANKAGFKLSTASYTDYDFVVNTSAKTFRLPVKVKGASGKAIKGNGKTLGLTNGNIDLGLISGFGDVYQRVNAGYSEDAYGKTLPYNNTTRYYEFNGQAIGVTTDATKSGIETSDSGLYLYFYVGETVQNANLINAGRIEEKLVDKVDKLQASACAMPSEKYNNLTLGASGTTYTAPANGWYYLAWYNTSSGGWMQLTNNVNGLTAYQGRATFTGTSAYAGFIPARKGDVITITYDAINKQVFRFIYAEGAK